MQNKKDLYKYLEKSYNNFTNTEKVFVHYILKNQSKAPFLSARDIARKINVNSSTLVRFTKKLGYSGYLEFQSDLRKLLVKEANYLNDFNKAKRLKSSKDNDIINLSLNKAYSNLSELLKNINEEKIEVFSNIICEARKKIIIANRGSYSAGHFLYFHLNAIITGMHFLNGLGYDYYDIFGDLNNKDIIIAISVPRYSKLTVDFVQYAVYKKLKVISITDSPISPLYHLSSSCLCVPSQSCTFHNSNVAMMALLDAVIAQISKQRKYSALKRLENGEKVKNDKDITVL